MDGCLILILQATVAEIESIYEVCWLLSPTQIQKLISNYQVADYEVCLDGLVESSVVLMLFVESYQASYTQCSGIPRCEW